MLENQSTKQPKSKAIIAEYTIPSPCLPSLIAMRPSVITPERSQSPQKNASKPIIVHAECCVMYHVMPLMRNNLKTRKANFVSYRSYHFGKRSLVEKSVGIDVRISGPEYRSLLMYPSRVIVVVLNGIDAVTAGISSTLVHWCEGV